MILTILTSISKVAIGAFALTLGAILVELYLISHKEKLNQDKKNIQIPEFGSGIFKPHMDAATEPVKIKKMKEKTNFRGVPPKYIFGFIGICAVIFAVVALVTVFQNKSELSEEKNITLPAGRENKIKIPSPSPTITVALAQGGGILSMPTVTATPTMLTPTPQPTSQAEVFAQAPSPTAIVTPTITALSPTSTLIATKTPSPTPTKTTTPTKATTPTLPVTGNYNMSWLLIAASFALIAFAFIF